MLKFKFYYFGHIQISENVSGIYAIVNTLNNKKYIGSSENLRKRYRQHFNNVNEYNSITDAAKAMGSINRRVQIKRCCQGKCKTAYKYKWRYKNDYKTD